MGAGSARSALCCAALRWAGRAHLEGRAADVVAVLVQAWALQHDSMAEDEAGRNGLARSGERALRPTPSNPIRSDALSGAPPPPPPPG
eukprot:COSAG01_NODE_13857_length_1526_cov_1.852838_2_plen_87_part_01